MPCPQAPHRRASGFTLLEMVVVMILLGIIAGIGVATYDRFDPGNRGALSSVQTFLETSRDQARVSGHPVVVEVQAGDETGGDRLRRRVQRAQLEATFEPARQTREGVQLNGAAHLGTRGRFGAALDLRDGGTASLGGGEEIPRTRDGYALELHFLDEGEGDAVLFEWSDLIEVRTGQAGDLVLQVRVGEGEFFQDARIDVPPGHLPPGEWHKLAVRVADGTVEVHLDGRLVLRDDVPPEIGTPSGAPRFGDPDDTFRGLIDEFTFRSRVTENGPQLRADFRVLLGVPQLVFDRYGLLDPAVHASGVPVELTEFDEVFASFVVGRFTEEVQP